MEWLVNLILGPVLKSVTAIFTKKMDVDVEKFKVDGQVDQGLLNAHIRAIEAKRDVLLEGMKYRGFRAMQYLFVYPLCIWWACIVAYCILKPYFPGLQPILALPDPLNSWAGGMISFLFLTSKIDNWVRKT